VVQWIEPLSTLSTAECPLVSVTYVLLHRAQCDDKWLNINAEVISR
jgi:hypothetical protein